MVRPRRARERAVRRLDATYDEFDILEVDDVLARRAGELAESHRLGGYDALHLAGAEMADDRELVVVAGDAALLRVAKSAGLATAALGPEPPPR